MVRISRLAVLLCATIPCAAAAALPAAALTLTDAAGRTVDTGQARRIVSVGGSVSEILAALGVADRVVAVDSTSKFPASMKAKPDVGYMRSLNPEGVLALSPDLVLVLEGSGPAAALDVLEGGSVPVAIVPEARTPEQVRRKIAFVAAAVGKVAEGDELADAVLADFGALETALAVTEPRRRAVFVLAVGGGAPVSAGRETAAEAMFQLAHVDNALPGFTGYKPIVDESAIAAAPDAVVMMAERGADAGTVLALPAFTGTPAARNGRLVAMPGSYLLGFGPRTPQAARDLAAAIYPERGAAPLPDRAWTHDAPPP